MSTTSKNTLKYGAFSAEGFLKVGLKCDHANFPIHQGDLVYLNGGKAKALDTDGNAASLAGVALQPSAVSSSIDNSSAPAQKAIQVGCGLVAELKTTTSEVYADGDLVYIGADAQTVTSVAGSNPVGRVLLPSNVSSVTGASGVTVDVLVYGRLPLKLAN